MVKFKDRVKQFLRANAGTAGPFELGPAAVGFQTLEASDDGQLFDVVLVDRNQNWAVYKNCEYDSTTNTLTRGTFVDSYTGSDIDITTDFVLANTLIADRTLAVEITSPTVGQTVAYDGTKWVNQAPTGEVTTAQLNAEITARTNSDYTLQTNINAEASARLAADNSLQTNINTEITARTNGDITLQNNINAEATARLAADNTLQSNINLKIGSVVEDLTPQLGGNLDVNAHSIVSVSNRDITFEPNGTGRVNVVGTLQTDRLQIDTTGTLLPTVGGLVWNDLAGTIEFQLKGGAVTLQVGQEQLTRIHNNTGSTLTDGQVVYIVGSTGTLPTVALADASSESTSSKTIGVVTESIAHGQDGFITTSGIVNGLNTNSYLEGDALWLSTTAGQFTNVRPTQPNHGVFIGWVVKKSGGNGSIYVHIQNGYELNELHDVLITSVANEQTIVWDSTLGVWKNTALKTVNGTSIVGSGNITVSAGESGFNPFLLAGM